MKYILSLFLPVLAISVYGQDKSNYIHFNKLTELTGTEYVLATIENLGKMAPANSMHLLFINTRNGESKQVNFRKDASIHRVEQIRIDSLQINRVLVTGRTVNLDNNSKGIDWNDPVQVIILSTDGQEKIQTEDVFFASTWATNRQTGAIVVTGHYDSNNNGKYDKTDKSQILLYDLKTLKLVSKL